jgi:hypothetical protein
MDTLFKKQVAGVYLEKISSKGNLIRTAEQFPSGCWVVLVYHGVDISGEYTETEFKAIRNKYFK